MNKHFIGGNLTKDATIFKKDGRDMLGFTVACNEGKDEKGNEYVEYVQVSCWGKDGFADKYLPHLVKGQGVDVVGKIVNKKPNEKDGTVWANQVTEVTFLRDIRLVGGSKSSQPVTDAPVPPQPSAADEKAHEDALNQAASAPAPDFDGMDDDIPF